MLKPCVRSLYIEEIILTLYWTVSHMTNFCTTVVYVFRHRIEQSVT
jgi:hypothetical protein